MATTILMLLLTVAVCGCALYAAVSDFRSLKIPNWVSLTIIVLFPIAWLIGREHFAGSLVSYLAVGGGMFVVSYILFAINMLGGGDSKLLVALGLWTGTKGLAPFLFVMAAVGGILSLIAVVVKKQGWCKGAQGDSWLAQVAQGRSAVPYGIAIAVGAYVSMYLQGFFNSIYLKTLSFVV